MDEHTLSAEPRFFDSFDTARRTWPYMHRGRTPGTKESIENSAGDKLPPYDTQDTRHPEYLRTEPLNQRLNKDHCHVITSLGRALWMAP